MPRLRYILDRLTAGQPLRGISGRIEDDRRWTSGRRAFNDHGNETSPLSVKAAARGLLGTLECAAHER